MANSRFYSSIAAVTNLQVTAAPSDATIQVASSAGFPGSFPYTLSLDYGSANEELVDVTSGGPTVFNVTRHVDGTSASTHNAGAIVRHVTSARDFTDSRTHEAATSAHGITGQFVDTLSVQTIANKTLTAPVVNSGALAGTFTGAPSFTGGPTFATASVLFQRNTGTNPAVRVNTAGDAGNRFEIEANGVHQWGDGTAAVDTNLYRSAANTLKTDDKLVVFDELQPQNLVRATRVNATDSQYETRAVGDANARWFIDASGKQYWGAGATAVDVSLQRSSANNLTVNGTLNATALASTSTMTSSDVVLTAQPQTSFTPVWTVNGSPATSVNVGWYWKLGKLVFFEIYTVWSASGTGTSNIAANLPTIPFRDGAGANTTRQLVSGYATGTNIISPGAVWGVVLAGGTGTAMTVLDPGNNALQSNNIQNGTIIIIQGQYREV